MSQQAYDEIIAKVKLLYKEYDKKANSMADSKNKSLKPGNQIDKFEDQFLQSLTTLEKNVSNTIDQMRKYQKGSQNEYRENITSVTSCLKDIRKLQQRPLNFKINQQIRQTISETQKSLDNIRKDLITIQQTKFLCCGTDGRKKFKTPMNSFRVVAAKWRMLAIFESKEGVETFISPKFNETDFTFINKILNDKWPKPEVPKVISNQKVIYVDNGKPSPLELGNQFIFGINREENLIEGLDVYHKQADRGNAQACCFLGKIYEEGMLVPIDVKKALAYYQKAIDGKDVYANYRYAICLIKGKVNNGGQTKEQIEKGFSLLNKISNESAEAMAELGQIYEYGSFKSDTNKLFTIKKDIPKAVAYYNKARTMKLPRASNDLGVLYTNIKLENLEDKEQKSDINSQLDSKIISYLTEAEEQGFIQAYYNLGLVYSKGIAGQKNSQLALQMFYEGSIKGDYKCKIKFAYELMNQTSIMKEEYEEHYHLAIHWLESVVRKLSINHTRFVEPPQILKSQKGQALFYLGIFHQHGFGVEKSPKKAISYFIESSDLDYPAAKNKIGDCYFSGFGLKKDRQLAVGCYLAAAEMGNSDAMVNLGSVYLNGLPGLVQKSYKKAFEYFNKAESLDNSDAMIHLSYMYKNGWGVPVSEESAQQLLEEAAILRNATALYMLKEQGLDFNERVLFEHIENEFFSAPKKIDLREVVPTLKSAVKSKASI